ncbi:MAG: cadherin-like domain-containing protein, partial [Planctomycetales bacterium]|nr:cadherin-like domain-containing protein [Planctomycetales bacterium]
DVTTANGIRDGVGLDDDPDSNNPNSTLKVVLVSGPSHASVFTLNGNDGDTTDDGAFSYKAAANYNGPDSFTYKLVDLFGVSSNTATVSINVAEVNDNPTANDDGSLANPLTLIKNTVANPFINQEINVTANDNNDPDFNLVENLTITGIGTGADAPQHGTVSISGDLKKVLYTPTVDFEGTDQFTYTISDGRGGSATATVYVEVVNFIPTDITGTVYVDNNNNGVQDGTEKPLAGVKITLQGHDDIFNIDYGADTDSNASNDVAALVVYTDINGNYRFDAPGSLRPGMRPGSYTILEDQPTFMRDGKDHAGNNATLVYAADASPGDAIRMTLPLLGVAGGINGNNFGERGLDPTVVSISDILASSTGDGLILAVNGATPLWYTRLTGWTNLQSCSVVVSGDSSTATFTFTDLQNNVYTRTISQVGNPRFRIMGRAADGSELIRLDGTAADFGLNLLAAGDNGQ